MVPSDFSQIPGSKSSPADEGPAERISAQPVTAVGCQSCGGVLSQRPSRPYPVGLQSVFGLSFVGFLLAQANLSQRLGAWVLWGWSALQLGLGVLLVRRRIQSSRRIRYCIRCGLTVA